MNKLNAKTKLAGIIGIVILIVVIIVIVIGNASKKQDIYREDLVKRGDLIVGIGASGSVDFGVIEQVFDADLSARSGAASETVQYLTVEQVCVSEGQTIQVGDPLYLLEDGKVTKLREELQASMEKAQNELDVVNMERESAEQSAKYAYDSSIAYGIYAEEEYNSTIRSMEAEVTEATQNLADAKSILAIYQEQLKVVKADYTTASNVLKECEKSRNKTDRTKNTNQYIEYFELTKEAQDNLDALAEKKEKLELDIARVQEDIVNYAEQVKIAQRNLNSGKLDAQEALELRKLAYDMAQATYDVTMEYWEENAKQQENAYAEAESKWETFNFYVEGDALKASESGVIREVGLAEGDSVDENDILLTLYNMEEVTMTVTLDEAVVADISMETEAEVSFQAYPNKTFPAVIADISEPGTSTVSGGDGQVCYDVKLVLQGDVSGLFQGMTGEVTFIKKAVKDVLYVSHHAIRREGNVAYVQVKDAEGNMLEKQVFTGFFDGDYVEILEGLSEGDVVCYTVKEEDTELETKKAGQIKPAEGQQLVYGRLTEIRGNEITYLVIEENSKSVTAGDALSAMSTQTAEAIVTTTIPVGVISDFSKLEVGQKLGLVLEQSEDEQVVTKVYLIK